METRVRSAVRSYGRYFSLRAAPGDSACDSVPGHSHSDHHGGDHDDPEGCGPKRRGRHSCSHPRACRHRPPTDVSGQPAVRITLNGGCLLVPQGSVAERVASSLGSQRQTRPRAVSPTREIGEWRDAVALRGTRCGPCVGRCVDRRSAPVRRVRYSAGVNNRILAAGLAVLTVIFVILNFTVEGAGTIFLILAVASGFGAAYAYRRP